MTLSEFNAKFFSRSQVAENSKIYVFHDEDSADNWIGYKYFDETEYFVELDMVIESSMILEHTVKEEWCKAEVQHFYAVEPDMIVVVVDDPYRKIEKMESLY